MRLLHYVRNDGLLHEIASFFVLAMTLHVGALCPEYRHCEGGTTAAICLMVVLIHEIASSFVLAMTVGLLPVSSLRHCEGGTTAAICLMVVLIHEIASSFVLAMTVYIMRLLRTSQ